MLGHAGFDVNEPVGLMCSQPCRTLILGFAGICLLLWLRLRCWLVVLALFSLRVCLRRSSLHCLVGQADRDAIGAGKRREGGGGTCGTGAVCSVILAFSLRYLLTLAAFSAACFCLMTRLSYVEAFAAPNLLNDRGLSRLRFPVCAMSSLYAEHGLCMRYEATTFYCAC